MHRSALPWKQKTNPSKENQSHARNHESNSISARPNCRHPRRIGCAGKGGANPARLPHAARVRRLGRTRRRGPQGKPTEFEAWLPALEQLPHLFGGQNQSVGNHRSRPQRYDPAFARGVLGISKKSKLKKGEKK